ncbi:hypothetical protein U1Q18_001456 [Sarracenia purpurea var. burkii]
MARVERGGDDDMISSFESKLMEGASSMVQKRKKHAQILEDHEHDYLTELPERLLHHILSFLTMKDVIRTSVLAKRWRHVWLSVPCLDYSLTTTLKFREIAFVYRSLLLHKGAKIQKMSIAYNCDYSDFPHIDSWIHFAITRDVIELYLDFFRKRNTAQSPVTDPVTDFLLRRPITQNVFLRYYKLPWFLFSSTSLTVLGLIRCLIGFPINFKLSSLKILSLEQVYFSGGTANDLISCCPILECLSLTNNQRPRKDSLCLMNVGLKTLKICDDSYSSDYSLTVYAPSVLSFELVTNLPMKNYVIKRMRHLQSASLDCGKESHGCFGQLNSEDKGYAVVKILDEVCCHVRDLTLCGCYIQVNDKSNCNVEDGEYWEGVEPNFVDLLCNLRTVKLFNFMKNLNLIERENASSTDEEEFPVQLQNDMKFMRFLLNNSKVLKRMIITSYKTVKFWHRPESKNLKLRLQLTRDLLSFPRASRNVEISFC